MAFYESYTVDQLNRLLTLSKWTLGILGVILALVGICNQWISDRITSLQKDDKAKSLERLSSTETELERTKIKMADVAGQLARFTTPRQLTGEQMSLLRNSLSKGPHGKVIITFLSVENDAEKYAEQIAELLKETGFDVKLDRRLWLQMALDGLYLCGREEGKAPIHAVYLQQCFKDAGIAVKGFYDPKFVAEMGTPEDGIVFVVSSRK